MSGGAFIPFTRSFIGIEDITSSAINSLSPHLTALTFLPSVTISVTFLPYRILPPISVTRFPTSSHSCPGPYFGYQNCSISEVSVLSLVFLPLSFVSISLTIAVIESPLTLCAPHSAEISLGCLPQSFSV